MNNNYYMIESIIKYLDNNFKHQPDLEELANHFEMSPFYLQKIFTDWVGISPKKFVQYITTNYLKSQIYNAKSLDEISFNAGLSSQSRVYDLFINFEGVTPNEYKTFGENLEIEYGFHETLFGLCLIATTTRGICYLAFVDNNHDEKLSELKKLWNKSKIIRNQDKTFEIIESIFNKNQKVKLFLKGTSFQLKVWEALLKIPEGKLSTYQGIAEKIDNPKASRAVGSAIGANNIAYLIPCHRVIRKEGIIGEYRWGSPRKKALIGFEMKSSN